MMWIILTTKLPTRPSPPKLSIFWSVPWPDDIYAVDQMNMWTEVHSKLSWDEEINDFGVNVHLRGDRPEDAEFEDMYGRVANWIGARKIHYAGCDIRVFPNEFNPVSTKTMQLYLFGGGGSPSHELVPEGVAAESTVKGVLDTDTRFIYDAALMDGCTESQALATALGVDITMPDPNFPPIGWYRIVPEYGELFCTEYELTEHREIPDPQPSEESVKKKSRRKKKQFPHGFRLVK